jgi:hypothetical protein
MTRSASKQPSANSCARSAIPPSAAAAPGPTPDPAIVYFDLIDGPPDSLTPKIVYRIAGSAVSLRLRIEQSGRTVKEERLTLSTEDKPALAAAIATKLATLASPNPHYPPKKNLTPNESVSYTHTCSSVREISSHYLALARSVFNASVLRSAHSTVSTVQSSLSL